MTQLHFLPSPSTDLYFLNSCGSLVSNFFGQKQLVRRLGANSFQCGNRFLVIRWDRTEVIRHILSHKDAEIIYLIDDDIWSAFEDSTLPDKYRKKLVGLTSGIISELVPRATHIVVSSDYLARQFPASIHKNKLYPSWHAVPSGDEHFNQQYIKIVHLGTNSHLAGFKFLKPILAQVIESNASVSFTYYSNTPLLGVLDKHKRVKRRKIMRWSKYRNQIGKECFHLGLYPILDTPFNRGRSHNKILEYSLAGCAALYSTTWNHADLIKPGENGWLCENDQEKWLEKILYLANNHKMLQRAFRGALQLFSTLNDLKRQRNFWQRIFIRE